jgi:16S rRNA (cytosine967-C5)-methyltransferase
MKKSPRKPSRGKPPIAATARSLAADILDATEKRDAWAEVLLDGALSSHPELAQRDKALTTQLVYGVLRHRYRLDRYIETGAKRPINKLQSEVVTLLRLGAFQLLNLDRIPASAAVNETVTLAKTRGLPKAAGLVNAVLRAISDGRATPAKPDGDAEELALAHSVPLWLARRWIEDEGLLGATLLAEATTSPPPLFLRALDEGPSDERDAVLKELQSIGEAGPGSYSPKGVWIRGAGNPRELAPVREGRAIVQGQASQLVPLILAPQPGWRVLDLCSAPGLKTTHLAELVGGEGSVTAVELHQHRAAEVQGLADALGYNNIKVVCADARSFASEEPFDAILADVPCTGLGILAHAPERKWRITEAQPKELATLQGEILDNAAALLRPGGVLVYSTCTTARAENEAVVEKFLSDHPDFSLERADAMCAIDGDLLDAAGHLRTFPRPRPTAAGSYLDGFFAARLVKKR